MKSSLSIVLALAGASLAAFGVPDASCNADNCLRAVNATRHGTAFQAQATSDCSYFAPGATVTPAHVTVTVAGVPAGETVSPRDVNLGLPDYAAKQCSFDTNRYLSACSCIGITSGAPTTLPAATVTITAPSSAPTCAGANLQTDPNNCGTCGNICGSGSCVDGVCVSTACALAECGSFSTCGSPTQNCFCFSNSNGVGFCGQDASCAGLPTCTVDSDCTENGAYVCAPNTCCGAQGVCLLAECDNPARKLIKASLKFAKGTLYEDTAAYRRRR